MEISHKFTYSDLYEKAKDILNEAGLPSTADVMWQNNDGPWLRFVPPAQLSESQLSAVNLLESIIQEDIHRFVEWRISNS